MDRAVIMVPYGVQVPAWVDDCTAYCLRRGYNIVAVIVGMSWLDAMAYTRAAEAEVIVVATRTHLDPNRIPRLESVTEDLRRPDGGSSE